jgi:hypothetical protein
MNDLLWHDNGNANINKNTYQTQVKNKLSERNAQIIGNNKKSLNQKKMVT